MSLLSCIKGFLGRRRKKATPAADVEKAFSESSIEEDTDDIGVPFVGTGGVREGNAPLLTLLEVKAFTDHFLGDDRFLGNDGFSRVHKGWCEKRNQLVAVKERQNRNMPDLCGKKRFTLETDGLYSMNHPNVVKLIGYCNERDERLVVYEYVPMGSLKDVLFGGGMRTKVIGWNKRIKIAFGLAKALVYCHDVMQSPHGNVKASNVLIAKNYKALLTDYGLSQKEGKMDHTNKGYNAPEIVNPIDKFTREADVYSYGIILLELVTGRRAYDFTRPDEERFLIDWALPVIKRDTFLDLIDPKITKNRIKVPFQELNYVVNLAEHCIRGSNLASVGMPSVPRFVFVISTLLRRAAEANDHDVMIRRRSNPIEVLSAFHGFFTEPSISLDRYMERIYTYTGYCSPSCYIVAYVYLDRFLIRHPRFSFDSYSVHRMILTSFMVAAKFMDDCCYSNQFFANVGGISLLEMNMMEVEFLFSMDFKLNVTPDDFCRYTFYLKNHMYIEAPSVDDLVRSQFFFSNNSQQSEDAQLEQ